MNDFMFELLKILLHCLVKIGRDLCRLNLFQGISAVILGINAAGRYIRPSMGC